MNQKENASNQKEEEFFVRLCLDVLFELLSFGNRRRLSKLERVGRRFHRMVENFFGKAPFIRSSCLIVVEPRLLFFNNLFLTTFYLTCTCPKKFSRIDLIFCMAMYFGSLLSRMRKFFRSGTGIEVYPGFDNFEKMPILARYTAITSCK